MGSADDGRITEKKNTELLWYFYGIEYEKNKKIWFT